VGIGDLRIADCGLQIADCNQSGEEDGKR
jgi:hypothetical protein